MAASDVDESEFDGLLQPHVHWKLEERPSDWGNPEQSMENQELWAIFDIGMTKMPETTARVFAMREFLGLEVDEICKEINITSSNCWVILHRARMLLRVCLQQRWFGESAS